MLHELPLVIFTIAAQMSAGSFIVLGIIQVVGFRVPREVMERVTNPALYAIGPLLLLGFAASTLHLGNPLNAINAVRHVSTSWLSREIVLGGAFLGLGGLFAVMQWFRWGSHRLRQVVAIVAAIVGAALVYAISQVYSLRTVPAWSTWYTPLRFFITSLLLGGVAVAAALVIGKVWRRRRGAPPNTEAGALVTRTVRGIALGSIVLLGLKFVGLPAYIGYLGMHPSPAAQESLRRLTETYGAFSAANTLLIFAGVMLLALLLFGMAERRPEVDRLLPALAVGAFLLILAGEVIGRMLFYASMVRVGL